MEEKRLKEGIESNLNLIKHASLHREACNHNWKFVRQYIKMNPDSLVAPISDTFITLTHVVARRKQPEAVTLLRELMNLVDHKSLEKTDVLGMTTLHYAALSGNVEAAKILLSNNRELLNIEDVHGFAPIYHAAKRGQKEMVLVLLPSSGLTIGEGPIDIHLVDRLITTNLFGIALHLIKNYSQRPFSMYDLRILFDALATKALAFQSGSQLRFWQELIYKCVPIERKDFAPYKYKTRDVENLFEGSEKTDDNTESTFLQNIFNGFGTMLRKVHVVIWEVIKRLVPGFRQIDEEKQKHNQAYLLLKHLRQEFERSAYIYEDAINVLKKSVHKAATMGIHELVNEVLETYPNSFHFYDEEHRNVLQLAVLHKREQVFIGIMERSSHYDISTLKDNSSNNLLHYAGRLAHSPHITGAALQMQKEIQWFKVLEDLVHPSLVEATNKDKKTPWEVFTEKHQELVMQGEKWMKNTATSCTVVAALTTTMVFTAAFTVPGGVDGNNGTPLFLSHSALLTFVVADTLALISSSTSILMFLGILTSCYSAIDFMESLPKKLMFGLITLFFSIASMITAFGAAIHIVLFRRFKWVDIPFSLLACFPVILFVWLQFPLLIDIYMSTYHSKICRLKRS